MSRRDVPRNPPGTPGLRRDPALVPLSRDHHEALVQVFGLRRAAAAGMPALRAAASDFTGYFRDELVGHMKDEEEVVLPAAPSADPAGAERIRTEHEELRALAARVEGLLQRGPEEALVEATRELAQLLDDHVRFEERAYFMRVQEVLPPEALRALGERLEAFRSARGRVESCRLPARLPGQGTS
jgi:hypothetical protein